MQVVHVDKDRAFATDGHVLVVQDLKKSDAWKRSGGLPSAFSRIHAHVWRRMSESESFEFTADDHVRCHFAPKKGRTMPSELYSLIDVTNVMPEFNFAKVKMLITGIQQDLDAQADPREFCLNPNIVQRALNAMKIDTGVVHQVSYTRRGVIVFNRVEAKGFAVVMPAMTTEYGQKFVPFSIDEIKHLYE
jgi:hypothetical protein